MNIVSKTFLSALLLAGIARAQAAPAWAILAEKATVRGLALHVGDVASVDGLDAGVVQRISSLELGDCPAAGRTLLLTKETILERLGKSPGDIPPFELRGANAVQIVTETVTLSSREVEALVRRALLRSLGPEARRTRVEPSNPAPPDLVAPAGRFLTTFKVELPKRQDLAGTVRCRVHAVTDGRATTSVPVSLVVRRQVDVLVAAEALPGGKPPKLESIRRDLRELGPDTSKALTDPSQLQHVVLKHRVPAGQILTDRDFKKRAIVYTNDPVKVVVKAGGLTVTGMGQALGEGATGDHIRVRTGARHHRTVLARIIDSQTVELNLREGS